MHNSSRNRNGWNEKSSIALTFTYTALDFIVENVEVPKAMESS